ncbi:RNA polymerase II transcription factor B subunit 4 [Tanacetum coccineum]
MPYLSPMLELVGDKELMELGVDKKNVDRQLRGEHCKVLNLINEKVAVNHDDFADTNESDDDALHDDGTCTTVVPIDYGVDGVSKHSTCLDNSCRYIFVTDFAIHALLTTLEAFWLFCASLKVYTIEFQKRLPRCHLCIWLESDDKLRTPADIDRFPAVERLPFHLPDKQSVGFDPSESIDFQLDKNFPNIMCGIKLTEFGLQGSKGELFYLRRLLNHVRGARKWEDFKEFEGIVYPTCKEACYAHDTMSRPEIVWEKTWKLLAEDVLLLERQKRNHPDLQLSDTQRYNICLTYIEEKLLNNSKSLKNIVNMPYPNDEFTMEGYESQVPLDSCVIGSQHSTFLQQASYITGGVYLRPQHLDGLFQYVTAIIISHTVFVTDLHSRNFLQLSKHSGVDFRASSGGG